MNEVYRQQLRDYLDAQREANKVSDDENADEATKLKAYGRVDATMDKLVLSLEDDSIVDPAPVTQDAEWEELCAIYREADGARYIQLQIEEKELDGAESELNAALKLEEGKLPIGLMLPREERVANYEELADAITAITTQTTVNTSPIAARLFRRTGAGFLGVQMPSVPSGVQRYPFLTSPSTSGANADVVARGAQIDAGKYDLKTVEVTPVALQATFIIDRDTLLQNGAEVRTVMENDLRQVMASQLDDEILQGDGATPTRKKGLFPYIKAETYSSGNIDNITTWAQAESIAATFWDGLHFYEDTSARMLIGVNAARFLRRLYQPASGGNNVDASRNALTAIRGDGVAVAMRDRVPAEVAKTTGKGRRQASIYLSQDGASNIIVPVWDSLDMLVDPYSSGRKRQVEVTMSMFFGLGYRKETVDSGDATIGAIPGVHKLTWVMTAGG